MAYQGKNAASCSPEQELISGTKNEQVQSAGKKLQTKGKQTSKLQHKLFLEGWKVSGVYADFSQRPRLIDQQFCIVGYSKSCKG